MSTPDPAGSAPGSAELRHELRTPFNAILNYTEMILETAAEDNLDTLVPGLEGLHADARDLLGTINSTLATGQDAGPEELARLSQLIAKRVLPLVAQVEELRTTAADLPQILADLDRVREAVRKLQYLGEKLPQHTRQPREASEAIQNPALPRTQTVLSGTVLVVDDTPGNRDVLCRRLEREGCTAVQASSGEEALALLASREVDVLLLDLLMPGMDGHTVLGKVKESPRLRHIPVIMISALDEMDRVVRCIEAGAEEFLTKPFDPVLLRARVGACLEKKRSRDRELEYLRGVSVLEAAASAIEESHFDPSALETVVARQDELGNLARVFQRMALEVEAREARLKQEVAQLKIEIDMGRLTRQVEEVTGGELFDSLAGARHRLEERRRQGRKNTQPGAE